MNGWDALIAAILAAAAGLAVRSVWKRRKKGGCGCGCGCAGCPGTCGRKKTEG